MARLIMGPKVFAAVMREIYGYRNLKVNRTIDQAVRRGSNLVVELDKGIANQFSALLHEYSMNQYQQSAFNDEYALAQAQGLGTMSEEQMAMSIDGLGIQYSVEEYRDLVERVTPEKKSILDPRTIYIHNVHVGISQYRKEFNDLFKALLARGSGKGGRNAITS